MDQQLVIVGLFLVILAVVGGSVSGFFVVLGQFRRREDSLVAMVKDLTNRVHATDLNGYLTIREQEGLKPSEIPRDDVGEMAIELARMGIAPEELGGPQ